MNLSGILQLLPGILWGVSKVLDQRWFAEACSQSLPLRSFINLTGSGPHLALPRW